MTFNIGILTACESERHLSEPIYQRLKELGMSPYSIHITQNKTVKSYCNTKDYLFTYKLDFVLAVGDRHEQIGGVLAAFDNKIHIGHLYSGDLDTGVSDDIHRAAITLYSSIQFCSSESAVINTKEIMRHAGLEPNAHFVGATHLDNIDINLISKENAELEIIDDETNKITTIEPYTLILINSEMKNSDDELIDETIIKALSCAYPINYLIVKGNGDNNQIEDKLFNELKKQDSIVIKSQNRVDRVTFLSRIKYCNYFITNSSAAIYEAPFLMNSNNILFVGKRNEFRTPITKEAHDGYASERVTKLIKEFLENK